MSKTVTWKYKGDADVVFGEIHISKAPKIILAITVITVIDVCVAGFFLRDFIYDALTNPQIMLKNVSQDDNGFYIEIPYNQENFNFIADSYIDTVNTREYESFIDPENKAYSFTIEGNVDTATIGDYIITYNSNNRVKHNTTTLSVRVKDITGPVVTLKDPKTGKELPKTSEGLYHNVTLRRYTNDTKNWNAEDYIMSITDNYSALKDITITYPEKPNFDSSSDDNIIVTYTATDSSGNISKIDLQILLVKQTIANRDVGDLIERQEQVNQLTEQTNRDDDNPNNDNDSGYGDQDAGINDDGTNTIKHPQLTADSFTWSMSVDGPPGGDPIVMQAFLMRAQSHIHYYDYDKNNAYCSPETGGVFLSYQPDGPGTYTINWQTPDGSLSCTQYVTLTE